MVLLAMKTSICRLHRRSPTVTAMTIASGTPWPPGTRSKATSEPVTPARVGCS